QARHRAGLTPQTSTHANPEPRRFRYPERPCPQATFAEQVDGLTFRHGRRRAARRPARRALSVRRTGSWPFLGRAARSAAGDSLLEAARSATRDCPWCAEKGT
ncbi:hypothetical protein ACFXDI_43700, partial [Streptomyces mirabilis]|uniref:hypothetical protein n=2 Tax=Streptomyces mirabilis TaxID=68239 RepID=UPI00369685F7